MVHLRVVSGGQTGVDRAALDWALELGLAVGGWCPLGRKAEDGTIPAQYPLKETPTDNYDERTEWNVRDSDATLILTRGGLFGGTLTTRDFALRWKKPFLVVELGGPDESVVGEWVRATRPATLNIAGPRESSVQGIYQSARSLLRRLTHELSPKSVG